MWRNLDFLLYLHQEGYVLGVFVFLCLQVIQN